MSSIFERLNAINVGEHIEQKNGLSYLSWAWAWSELKKVAPDATYTIYENENGWNYHTDGKTCWVKTGVTVEGTEYIEYLPIMNFKNQSIPLEFVSSMDVNKAIQRSLTKAVARHGLGLYIYAGEDLPEAEQQQVNNEKIVAMAKELARTGVTEKQICARYKVKAVANMTDTQYQAAMKALAKTPDKKEDTHE